MELPENKYWSRSRGVAMSRQEHLDMFSNCDFGSPQNPKAPEEACPNWNIGDDDSDQETESTDSLVDVSDSGVRLDNANIGVQYCLEKSGGPRCGWGEEWIAAMPQTPSQSGMMWGIDFRKIGESVGTCVLSTLSTDLPT